MPQVRMRCHEIGWDWRCNPWRRTDHRCARAKDDRPRPCRCGFVHGDVRSASDPSRHRPSQLRKDESRYSGRSWAARVYRVLPRTCPVQNGQCCDYCEREEGHCPVCVEVVERWSSDPRHFSARAAHGPIGVAAISATAVKSGWGRDCAPGSEGRRACGANHGSVSSQGFVVCVRMCRD